MQSHAEKSPRVDSELLAQTWTTPDASSIEDRFLHHGLVAVSCFSRTEREKYHASLLEELLRLFGAERAFIFNVSTRPPDEVEIEGCVASVDLDGDPVHHPERKAPRDVIRSAAAGRAPILRELGDEPSGEGRSALLALPAVSRQRTTNVVLLENRFRDLEIAAETVAVASVYCQSLAAYEDLADVVEENQSLWNDISRLREAMPRSNVPSVAAPPRDVDGRDGDERRATLKGDYSMIVGSSRRMVEILEVIDRISGSTAPVLINGESGTGKELAALAVHRNSPRRNGTFVSENCGAITETLLESELFGYVKGAFTGATRDHQGLFEIACGGTLFLDEVGDMSPSMQKKLLRVLQEGVIRPVGARSFTKVDVRIISATNKDLLQECRAGNFREDLYYRLNVINLKLPPLRDRSDDIPALVRRFLTESVPEGSPAKELEPAAMERLMRHSWPGNIRELQNEVKKLVALSEGPTIRAADLSSHLCPEADGVTGRDDWLRGFNGLTLKEATERLERELIRDALEESGGNKSLVAKSLQIPKTSLYNKINKYGLA